MTICSISDVRCYKLFDGHMSSPAHCRKIGLTKQEDLKKSPWTLSEIKKSDFFLTKQLMENIISNSINDEHNCSLQPLFLTFNTFIKFVYCVVYNWQMQESWLTVNVVGAQQWPIYCPQRERLQRGCATWFTTEPTAWLFHAGNLLYSYLLFQIIHNLSAANILHEEIKYALI